MDVQRWMSQPVISVHEDCPGMLAYQKMLENQIRRLPVVDEDGALVGMITDRDLRAIALASVSKVAPEGMRDAGEALLVRDLMTREIKTVAPNTDIREAALLMHNHKFGGLPVVQGGAVVGMITTTDLMEILVAALDKEEHSRA